MSILGRNASIVATSMAWGLSREIVKRSKSRSIVVVTEYPKCGGSWLAKTLASAVGLPYVGGGIFLPVIPSVLRVHWLPDLEFRPGVIVVRDVRDVMISMFHHRARNIERTPVRRRQFEAQFGMPLSPEHMREQLPGFMEIEFDDPRYGAHVNWSQFVSQALRVRDAGKDGQALVRYEDALADTPRALKKVLDEINMPVGEVRLRAACHLQSAKTVETERSYLDETTFLRVASSGGWREHFSRDSARFIAQRCGPELAALSYEEDSEWWKSVE